MSLTFQQLASVFISLILLSCSSSTGEKLQANVKSEVLKVDYVVTKPEPLITTLKVTGTLMPAEQAELSTQTAGKVEKILFEEGQMVRQGQTLLKLDDREWQAQLQRLKAELEIAEKDLKRKSALAQVQGITTAELETAQLRVQTLKANQEETQVRLSYATIKAPFSGQIGLRTVSPGSYLSAGTAVALLVKSNPIKIQFNVPEKHASKVQPGQKLTFIANQNAQPFEALVYATEPMITTGSRSLQVKAKANNSEGALIPGAYADITLRLDSLPGALLVPTEAIVPQLNGQLLYRIKNGKAQEVEVRTGERHPKRIHVTEGLQAGDTVVVTGLLQIKPGMPVAGDKQLKVESFDPKP